MLPHYLPGSPPAQPMSSLSWYLHGRSELSVLHKWLKAHDNFAVAADCREALNGVITCPLIQVANECETAFLRRKVPLQRTENGSSFIPECP